MTKGVQVVAARHDGVTRAYTSHWISQISFEEPVLLASVSRKHDTHALIEAAEALVVVHERQAGVELGAEELDRVRVLRRVLPQQLLDGVEDALLLGVGGRGTGVGDGHGGRVDRYLTDRSRHPVGVETGRLQPLEQPVAHGLALLPGRLGRHPPAVA